VEGGDGRARAVTTDRNSIVSAFRRCDDPAASQCRCYAQQTDDSRFPRLERRVDARFKTFERHGHAVHV